jgi:hypothetical protein
LSRISLTRRPGGDSWNSLSIEVENRNVQFFAWLGINDESNQPLYAFNVNKHSRIKHKSRI